MTKIWLSVETLDHHEQNCSVQFFHDEVGYNYRLPTNAALGCAQMERLEDLAAKAEVAKQWSIFFDATNVSVVTATEGTTANYWLNAIICDTRADRDQFWRLQ